jgi:hypothetical protein
MRKNKPTSQTCPNEFTIEGFTFEQRLRTAPSVCALSLPAGLHHKAQVGSARAVSQNCCYTAAREVRWAARTPRMPQTSLAPDPVQQHLTFNIRHLRWKKSRQGILNCRSYKTDNHFAAGKAFTPAVTHAPTVQTFFTEHMRPLATCMFDRHVNKLPRLTKRHHRITKN